MALVSTRTYDWQDLADDSVTWGDTNAWLEWTGNGTTINGSTGFDDLVHTSAVFDLGTSVTFYPVITAEATGTVTIKLLTSLDGIEPYTEVTPAVLTARYVKTKVTVANATATAELSSLESEFFTDALTETIVGLSIGATETTLPIRRVYGLVQGVSYNAPQNMEIILTDANTSAPKVTNYNLDTWGKVATATTATVTVEGYPAVSADSNGNIIVS
tara:strand:- start:585 stop:1232 length:648 start_codon:yes stop_codon:yes gene_type:complete